MIFSHRSCKSPIHYLHEFELELISARTGIHGVDRMKFGARSPTSQKDRVQWVSVGRQILQEQGGLAPLALKTRPIQSLFGFILLLVTTTLFVAVLAIGDTMSLKVRVGLTFKPPLLRQLIDLQNEAENSIDEFYKGAQRHPDFELPSNPTSFLAMDLNAKLPIQQQHQEQKESEVARNDDDFGSNSSKKRAIEYTGLKNGHSPEDHHSAGIEQQRDSILNGSKRTGRGSIGLDDEDGHVDNEALHQLNNTSTTPHEENSTRSLNSKSGSPELSGIIDRAQYRRAGWLQFPELYTDGDETEQLMVSIRQNGTLPCHQVRTKTAQILGLPQISSELNGVIQLEAGSLYELVIQSIGDDEQPRCAGGDYYETDLSGPLWKSRPPVVDLSNGTYAVHLQMDPRFAGRYTFTVVLLFANFHALHFHPKIYARMEDIATFEIEFLVPDEIRSDDPPLEGMSNSSSSSTAAAALGDLELPMCKREDFDKKYWSGRWTREKVNEDCEYDRHGRWQCVDINLDCQKPWCEGPVGSLESNGWVYSAHCAFKIFQKEEAWKCLDGKWFFFWGDSNHIDTIRNLLNFVLGFDNEIKFLDRRMDMTFSSPPDNKSSVRITSMFNGHSNVSLNYEGLFSLHNEEYATQLRSYFTGETAPDFLIMNSGLHDGLYWRNMERFLEEGVGFASEFWSDVWNNMTARRPDVLYRTTVATGGQSRNESFNPHKMELFNHLIVDMFLKMKLERFQIIDGFDYTFPWHWDHKTNDGVHYGRPPSKTKWAGNNVGHRYFVDLMLVHMLLNAICIK